ncbi:hypothetical protein [Flavivirga spongiicola]|uniref:Lipoprotein n=1 Tax=Flavivirga spongiicola TaxID=421621 RepID=A0ABU7XXY1_9FLAO|nr:hypothetical protein [Flavivirga sp. MEBiC05379]MDO5980648.1 hypothetical protein [Flavivirga sp. MEBiC05379]
MKHFFKTLFIATILLGVFQSCSSVETGTLVTSDEKISSSLANKIIATAASTNDLDLINFDCSEGVLVGHFMNSQGDYYGAVNIELSKWNEQFPAAKAKAYSDTGIQFTPDDYFLDLILDTSVVVLQGEENFIKFFDDCSFEGDVRVTYENESLALSDINYNCSGKVKYHVEIFGDRVFLTGDQMWLSGGIAAAEEALLSYNTINNTTYTLDDVRISSVEFESPGGTASKAIWKSQMTNYFEDCKLDRDINDNDCINFKYPFVMNKINLKTDEIIPVTITNDSELNETFFDQFENLTINYPLTLVTINGDEVMVKSNKELEETLTNSASYCTDEW